LRRGASYQVKSSGLLEQFEHGADEQTLLRMPASPPAPLPHEHGIT
jgi:hypothetical protein